MSKTANFILFGTIFTTGAAVLIFEVAAVRALSPHFGSSIYVVSSVLTIILAALSLGYYFGGRLADKQPHVSVLYTIIGLSGLTMNVLYFFSLKIFPAAGVYLPITIGPLVLSAIFFLFPAFLLGIDSPFVIKLLTTTDDHKHNGAIVGSTFFWSTVGSIVGSLVSGFYLIPFLGLRLTFAGTATLLSVLSVIAIFVIKHHTNQTIEKRQQLFILAIALVSIVVASITLSGEHYSAKPGKLLHASDGYYSQIEVREMQDGAGNTIRTLYREINHSSGIMTGTTTLVLPYAEYVRAYGYLQDETESFLLIGGGAYTLPRTLLVEEPELEIDVVEIEPKLYDLAKEYFELPNDPRLTNYPIDARIFLNHSEKKYDVIFGDAFQSGHFIPPHLATREFFVDIKNHLTEDGVFIANIIGATNQDKLSLTGSLVKTIQSVFPNLETYAVQPHGGLKNLMIIAKANGESSLLPVEFMVDLKDGNRVPATERWVPLDSLFLDKQIVFTDDLSRVEPLLAQRIFNYY